MSDRVSVTGGTGFISAHVARHLLAAGYDVVVLDDMPGRSWTVVPEREEIVEASILDSALASFESTARVGAFPVLRGR